MCELKQLGARGGSLLLWSTYVTLINTQQSFTHVWGNKKPERDKYSQYTLPCQPPSIIIFWNISAAFCSKYISCIITSYRRMVDWGFQMRSLAGMRAARGWFLKVLQPWSSRANPRSEMGLTPESWSDMGRWGTWTDQGARRRCWMALQGEGGCSDNSELFLGEKKKKMIRACNNGISKVMKITWTSTMRHNLKCFYKEKCPN